MLNLINNPNNKTSILDAAAKPKENLNYIEKFEIL